MALGAISDRVRSHIPETYSCLVASSVYGETLLQQNFDDIKYNFFATVVDFGDEASLYDRFVVAYVGKYCALKLIPAGIDYWMNNGYASQTLDGTQEQRSYFDKINALQKIADRLAAELADEKEAFEDFVGIDSRENPSLPAVSTSGQAFLTSDPYEFWKEDAGPGDFTRPYSSRNR